MHASNVPSITRYGKRDILARSFPIEGHFLSAAAALKFILCAAVSRPVPPTRVSREVPASFLSQLYSLGQSKPAGPGSGLEGMLLGSFGFTFQSDAGW
jgi:hypothetical protein